MDGQLDPAALELALVKEAQPRREECRHCRRPVDLRGERGRGPRLVVVLEEAGQVVLEVEAREEVLADRARVARFEAIVEPLVVGVVEALLLERPFQVPVDLGEEQEIRHLGADGRRRARPERRGGDPPGALEDRESGLAGQTGGADFLVEISLFVER